MPSIAHYNLLESIGTGGLGEVFRARDTKVGRTVALKLLSAERRSDPARLERLLEDARQAATVSHPNVATLWDVGEGDGQIYLAYEFVAGRRLRDETGGVPMNPRRALDLAIQIADGVSEAHSRGILHGDLRPDTIMVTAKGNAKVLDCGMAPWTNGGAIRAAGAASPDRLPQEAVSVLAYLSPEQAIAGGVDARTDVFSLGILTYEMLTGRNPFLGGTPADTILNVIQGRFTPPSEVNPAVPRDLDTVLAHALTPDIAQRQQSTAAFAAELRSVAAVLDVRTGDVSAPSAELSIDDSPDRRSASLLYGALTAAAVAAAGVWWWLSH